MTGTKTLAEHSSRLLADRVVAESRVHGGDLSEVVRLGLASGRSVVAKSSPFAAQEAAMLVALHAAGTPAPDVVAGDVHILIMEDLGPGAPPSDRAWTHLGKVLRTLHGTTAAEYGWPDAYAFGTVRIENCLCRDWPSFWADRRLLSGSDAIPADLRRRLERVARVLPDLLPGAPPASLLHGDLWSGNIVFARDRVLGLIDPACYHGHAEVDLAMLNLFGGTPDAFQASYGDLGPGWQERRCVYQLWPALVHLRLFGEGYRGLVERLLGALDA